MKPSTNLLALIPTICANHAHPTELHLHVSKPDGCIVGGSTELWSAALNNLVRNACVVTPPEKPVQVILRQADEVVDMRVVDRGCGIPAEDFDLVVEGPAMDDVRLALLEVSGSMSIRSTTDGCSIRLLIPLAA